MSGMPSSPSPEPPAVGPEMAEERIRAVLAWYSQEIIAERRAPHPDEERIRQLMDARAACAADQQALLHADSREAARIADAYAARYAELTRPKR
ncbi:hypothetical protein AB0G73_24165 [Streptomyces sp. NPDC020719]|uniref:hypothetical protein n=1 Tax=Streptomyces sp. NPDC020719 TaxID=3154896 RepID=UPI0033DE630E